MNSKASILLVAEIMLYNELITYDMYDAILDMRGTNDVYELIERMWSDEFKGYRKGESEFASGNADRQAACLTEQTTTFYTPILDGTIHEFTNSETSGSSPEHDTKLG